MRLGDYFTDGSVRLALRGATPDAVLAELVGLLHLDDDDAAELLRVLQRRESLGSTGVGHGIAIPHSRSLAIGRLRLAYGRRPEGVEYDALDGQPVYHFFLIVAPPSQGGAEYLPVLGQIARFVKEPGVPERLAGLTRPEDFLALLDQKGV
ncbi:MAG TPA: PTS sugar transporter subunit IIA [Gemmatimonadales bacterium]|nr:PTS sugar transporter subunit IIA [Gemmatimonadales bacterium]